MLFRSRHGRLFRCAPLQCVELPEGIAFEGEEAVIRRGGENVILWPIRKRGWPPGYWQRIDALREGMRGRVVGGEFVVGRTTGRTVSLSARECDRQIEPHIGCGNRGQSVPGAFRRSGIFSPGLAACGQSFPPRARRPPVRAYPREPQGGDPKELAGGSCRCCPRTEVSEGCGIVVVEVIPMP